jgi:hypothetical protein
MTEQHRKLTVFEVTPVPQLNVNTLHLTNLKRRGEHSMDMCKATMRTTDLDLKKQEYSLIIYLEDTNQL